MAMQDAGIFVQLVWEIGFEMLFEDYFNEAKHFSTRITLKPIDDPHVDLIATLSPPYQCLLFILLISELVAGPLVHKPKEKIVGNAQFCCYVDDPHTFVNLFLSNTEPNLLMRSRAYYQKFGFGAFGIFRVLLKQRVSSEDYGVMGLKYGFSNLSIRATVIPFFSI
ncbi:Hypothetical predicted protein [Olea europaea subsp. europaea]|uniref:Uncharacterized protein n=1 Tax=Olea europaea subsp. europaea TaxID=158383 RepID=A0A8S0SL43_OLEEU|nr:Hypothetical predicted protein [Olea europaea subsp. europaea]